MTSSAERDGYAKIPSFKTRRRKPQRPGGAYHSAVTSKRNEIAQGLADSERTRFLEEEVDFLRIGEPSEAFYPFEEEDESNIIIFPAPSKRSKHKKNLITEYDTSCRFNGVIVTPREEVAPPDYNKVEQILSTALSNQLILAKSGAFEYFKNKTDSDFLNASWQDPFFLKTYSQIKDYAPSLIEEDVFNKGIRGAIFETMSYLYLSSLPIVDGRRVPVFGDAVVEVMKTLHPTLELSNNGLGQGMLSKYVPDGLFVTTFDNKPKIDGIIECSLGKWANKPRNAEQAFGMHKLVQSLDPVVFDPKCYIVTPRFYSEDDLMGQSMVDMVSLTVPFSQYDFINDFMVSVYSDFRIDGGKTIEELRLGVRQK